MAKTTQPAGAAIATSRTDFSRTDYILCAPHECHVLMNVPCYFAQGADEAIEIVIRKDATDDNLKSMHDRFGVPMAEMIEFRASRAA